MVEGTSFGWFPFSGFSSYPIIFTKERSGYPREIEAGQKICYGLE